MKLFGTTNFVVLTENRSLKGIFFSIGLLKIADLPSGDNTTFSFTNLMLNPEQSFFVMSIIDSIPAHWCTIIKDSSSLPIISPISDVPTIIIDGNSLTFSDVSSKQIYCPFQAKKQGLPTAQKKLSDKYPDSAIDWEKVYSLPFSSSMESKLREFQYKVLHCIIFTNEKLYRFGIMQSPLCTFCQREDKSIEHLLFSCKESSEFWKHVLSWLRDNDINVGKLRKLI